MTNHEALLAGNDRPIVDTHIHVFQVDRPGGVPWPGSNHRYLYRNALPADYKALAAPLGVVASGIVEASPLQSDTRWVVDQIAGNPFFPFYVAQLEVGAPDFARNLDEIAAYPAVVGIRSFLWSPAAITLDDQQLADLRALAARGMTLDLISRFSKNPKAQIDHAARAVPDLRIIIDHLAGARGRTPDPQWIRDVQLLARHPQIHLKWSSFFDMYNPSPTGAEDERWQAPTDLADYRPHFDVVYDVFGPDRLIFGSNWPVVTMGGSLADEIALAESYLADKGKTVRDKVMARNALAFYRRAK